MAQKKKSGPQKKSSDAPEVKAAPAPPAEEKKTAAAKENCGTCRYTMHTSFCAKTKYETTERTRYDCEYWRRRI